MNKLGSTSTYAGVEPDIPERAKTEAAKGKERPREEECASTARYIDSIDSEPSGKSEIETDRLAGVVDQPEAKAVDRAEVVDWGEVVD